MRQLRGMRPAARIGAFAALLAGCGTEPRPDVAGAWNLMASYAGGSLACTVLATLTLEGSEPSLPGTLAEEQVDCSDAGVPVTVTADTLSLTATVQGRSISFTPQWPEGESHCAVFNFEGAIGNDRMSGTVGTRPVFCQGTYVEMTGTWQALRE